MHSPNTSTPRLVVVRGKNILHFEQVFFINLQVKRLNMTTCMSEFDVGAPIAQLVEIAHVRPDQYSCRYSSVIMILLYVGFRSGSNVVPT
jgi:hypothetical protein